MKKLIALLLCMAMVMAMFVGCGKNEEETTPVETEPVTEAPTEEAVSDETQQAVESTGALAILEGIWNVTSENEKFPVFGGDAGNMVDGAPGVYSLEDTEALTAQLLVPADQVANIDQAASLFHGMMTNNFTCGVFHVTGDVKAFAEAMNNAVANNQWLCGIPEAMVVAVIDSEYVLMAYGLRDVIKVWEVNMKEACTDVSVVNIGALG